MRIETDGLLADRIPSVARLSHDSATHVLFWPKARTQLILLLAVGEEPHAKSRIAHRLILLDGARRTHLLAASKTICDRVVVLAGPTRSSHETSDLALLELLLDQVVKVEVTPIARARTEFMIGAAHLALLHIAHLGWALDSSGCLLDLNALRCSLGLLRLRQTRLDGAADKARANFLIYSF